MPLIFGAYHKIVKVDKMLVALYNCPPMSKRKKGAPTPPKEIKVRLKPIFGIKPGLYLSVIYLLLIIAILFFILVLPGLRKNGTYVSFNTIPKKAAVYVDGNYAGSTPCEVFIEKGLHEITIRKAFYKQIYEEKDIKGRVFGSMIFPLREKINVNLEIVDVEGLLKWKYGLFSDWSLIESIHERYQAPPILSETVLEFFSGYRTVPHSEYKKMLENMLSAAMPGINNEYALKDALLSWGLYYSEGQILTPAGLYRLLGKLSFFKQEYENIPFWVLSTLSGEKRESLISTEWYRRRITQYETLLKEKGGIRFNPGSETGTNTIMIEGIPFVYVQGGEYIMGAGSNEPLIHPHPVKVEGFFMSAGEITQMQYKKFLDENPDWKPENQKNLEKEGLVTENYLKGWSENESTPVSHISYFAARAFCEWLETKLPYNFRGYRARLPLEEEWEWAHLSRGADYPPIFYQRNSSGPQSLTSDALQSGKIFNLMGNLWEWCEDWFYPGAYFFTSWKGERYRPAFFDIGSEKVVRGGSWANPSISVDYTTRGSQPPSWCTPVLGFRPVIIKQ
ncbi:MAG: hypothetical protein DRP87_02180 [Spirochaetes bacterium]|nr:MAG: hypothetical protein DRP87_02180 [Spirochaetota bacterium]